MPLYNLLSGSDGGKASLISGGIQRSFLLEATILLHYHVVKSLFSVASTGGFAVAPIAGILAEYSDDFSN